MKRRTAKQFKLIPSKKFRSDPTASISFIPAIPVRLVSEHGKLHYALIDTTAERDIVNSCV